MKAEVQAKELVNKMFSQIRTGKIDLDKELSKKCAIVAVDKILDILEDFDNAVWEPPFTYSYWISVRKQLSDEK